MTASQAPDRPCSKHRSQSTPASERPWGPGVRGPPPSDRGQPSRVEPAPPLITARGELFLGCSQQAHFLPEHFCQLLSILIFWQPGRMLFCKRAGKLQTTCSLVILLRTQGWAMRRASPCPCAGPHAPEGCPPSPPHPRKHPQPTFTKENPPPLSLSSGTV